MKGELEFLQGAFEAYKGTLVQDMEEKWAKKESDMKIRFQEDMDKAIHEQSKCQEVPMFSWSYSHDKT